MDTVTILRELWRLRRFVIGVCLLALLAGTAVVYSKYEVGVATAQILVDTPNSQVVEVAPKGYDTTGVRANLLASLMVDGVVKSAIAARAGLQPNQLVGVDNAAVDPGPVSAAPVGPHAFVLTTQVPTDSVGDELPIIELDAQAPNSAEAARLANAAIAGLSDYLDSKAALQRVPDAARLQVTGLGVPQATTAAHGASIAVAIAVAIVVFLLGCAGILGVLALVRGWRAASAREQLGDDELLVGNVGPMPNGGVMQHERVDSRRRFVIGPSKGAPAEDLAPERRLRILRRGSGSSDLALGADGAVLGTGDGPAADHG
jgi:flagellar basal body-associated protein FliL